MRDLEILKKTTNRSVYNKLYKKQLEQRGKIRCSYCGYHSGENDKKNWYGTIFCFKDKKHRIKYPSWKMVSKNSKQWMKKPIKFKLKTLKWSGEQYTEIVWQINF